MFSSEVRRNGEATREANHGLKTALGTVLGFFWLGIIVYSDQSDTCMS